MSDAPVKIIRSPKACELFEMVEGEVEFTASYFHLESVGLLNYHNAYDADETYMLFRADAVWTYKGIEYVVPVFAMQQVREGSWRWIFRFRPHFVGSWQLRIRVLCWHPRPVADDKHEKDARRLGLDGKPYYEHQFGYNDKDYDNYHEAQLDLEVREGKRLGPLEAPDARTGDNFHYFYRWMEANGTYGYHPLFLLGTGRAWNTESGNNNEWKSLIDRENDLFSPMHKAGCNVLYQWMAPWETQLVHQAEKETWPDAQGRLTGFSPRVRLSGGDTQKGYKRYDQGRAQVTDHVLDLADKYQILLFIAVMAHQSLQIEGHPWSNKEMGWDKRPDNASFQELNGFQLFKFPRSGSEETLRQFFEMDPDEHAAPWKRQLWKHFANFWRYLIGRWTAHPALGAWVLIDELEGVGKNTMWWWDNKDITGRWHNNLVQLIRGNMHWKWQGKDLLYTGDYLLHPLSTSTTHYEGTMPRQRMTERDAQGMLGTPEKPGRGLPYDYFGELSYHGTWQGTPHEWLRGSDEQHKLDFLSHHAYQAVPSWGVWTNGRYSTGSEFGWYLPNSEGLEHINTDRWLWDSLCMRLRNWAQAMDNRTPIQMPKLVTEYGCIERPSPRTTWNFYGKRNPSFTHFANWAALIQGHAGVPFKWNDGQEFGEMASRSSDPWKPPLYPVNNYVEMTNIANFLKGVPLDELKPEVYEIVTDKDKSDPNFCAWALTNDNHTLLLLWIYDRTFMVKGNQPAGRRVKIKNGQPRSTYTFSWFNPWDGADIPKERGKEQSLVSSDKGGILLLPLPTFPHASDLPGRSKTTVDSADGNDIALRLTLKG